MRLRVALPACLLVALCAAPASAGAAQSVTCAPSSAIVLFWPKGHQVVPGVDFPKILTPHIEVYGPGEIKGYPPSTFLLYADAKRVVDPSRTCGSGPRSALAAVRHPKVVRATKAVLCTATVPLAYDIARSKRGLTITGHAGPDSLFKVEVRPKRSTLTYDRSACRAAPKPR